MKQQIKISAMIVTLAFAGLFLLPANLLAGWQIEHTNECINRMRAHGNVVPKRIGNFSSREECEAMIRRIVRETDGAYSFEDMTPVPPAGYNDRRSGPGSAAQSDGRRRRLNDEQDTSADQHAESERQARESELARQQEFIRRRDKRASRLKGSSTLVLKGSSTLVLKERDQTQQQEFDRERDKAASRLKPSSAIRQLESVAGSSQQAAGTATSSQLDPARPQSEFDASNASRIPISSVPVPEPPPPIPVNALERLHESIRTETKIATDALRDLDQQININQQAKQEAARQAVEQKAQYETVQQRIVQIEKTIPSPRLSPEGKKQYIELRDDLAAEAAALMAEVEAENEKVTRLTHENDQLGAEKKVEQARLETLQQAFTEAQEHPERAEEILRQLEEENR